MRYHNKKGTNLYRRKNAIKKILNSVHPDDDAHIDDFTGKPVYGKEYTTEDGEEYRITYDRKGDISRQNFIDLLSGPVKLGAKLIGFDGSYPI